MEQDDLLELDLSKQGGNEPHRFKIAPITEDMMKEAHIHFLELLRTDPNNFAHWAPCVSEVVERYGVRFPKSVTIEVDPEVIDGFGNVDMGGDSIVDQWFDQTVVPVIRDLEFPLFVKNGCFSNKFDFGNSCFLSVFDRDRILRQLKNIQTESFCLDTFGNNLLVFRQWIAPAAGTPTIYNGMPLRPELRVFYDFDKHALLYDVNYWDWDYCHDRICEDEADKVVYEGHYPSLVHLLAERKERYMPMITEALSNVTGLEGIWSVDFLLEEEDVWLIAMAIGERSAYWRPQ